MKTIVILTLLLATTAAASKRPYKRTANKIDHISSQSALPIPAIKAIRISYEIFQNEIDQVVLREEKDYREILFIHIIFKDFSTLDVSVPTTEEEIQTFYNLGQSNTLSSDGSPIIVILEIHPFFKAVYDTFPGDLATTPLFQ